MPKHLEDCSQAPIIWLVQLPKFDYKTTQAQQQYKELQKNNWIEEASSQHLNTAILIKGCAFQVQLFYTKIVNILVFTEHKVLTLLSFIRTHGFPSGYPNCLSGEHIWSWPLIISKWQNLSGLAVWSPLQGTALEPVLYAWYAKYRIKDNW